MSNSRFQRKSNCKALRKSSIISVLPVDDIFQLVNEAAEEYKEAIRQRDQAERAFTLHAEKMRSLIRQMLGVFDLSLD